MAMGASFSLENPEGNNSLRTLKSLTERFLDDVFSWKPAVRQPAAGSGRAEAEATEINRALQTTDISDLLGLKPTEQEVANARRVLDAKADDAALDLSAEERKTLKTLHSAILDGDMDAVGGVLLGHKDSPAGLQKVMDALAKNLEGTGVMAFYNVAEYGRGTPLKMFKSGMLAIAREDGSKYIQASTETGRASLGGPVGRTSDGHLFFGGVAYTGSAQPELQQIGHRLARQLGQK